GFRAIAHHGLDSTAFFPDDTYRVLCCGFIEIGSEDAGALPRQQGGNCLPVSPAFSHRTKACDERNLVVQPEHACLASVIDIYGLSFMVGRFLSKEKFLFWAH